MTSQEIPPRTETPEEAIKKIKEAIDYFDELLSHEVGSSALQEGNKPTQLAKLKQLQGRINEVYIQKNQPVPEWFSKVIKDTEDAFRKVGWLK